MQIKYSVDMFSLTYPSNDMTSQHYHHQHNGKVERVSIGKDYHATFIEQFVKDVYDFSSQYGNNISISYTAHNITGPPSKFPEYGDFPQAFVMRTYGVWWDKSPSRSIDYMPQNNLNVVSHDYIDIEYAEAVYPIRVSIYEIYNPGSVIRIWAQDFHDQWFQLWSGPPQIVSQKPRIFSPPLKSCNFKTKMLRLEFNHSQLDYYTELDAALLIETFNEDVHNLTPDYKSAKQDLINLKRMLHGCIKVTSKIQNYRESKLISKLVLEQLYHCVPPFREGCNSMQQFLLEDFSRFMKNIQDSSDESKEPPCDSFSMLPDETILKIFKNLDLKSLYCLCRVNKHFNNLARDALLYTCLNLKPYWNSFDARALNCLASRCKYLRQLDLSWCGNHDMFSTVHIRNFLKVCGSLLTHLRLNCCETVDNSVVHEISRTCKNLKELSLRNCQNITGAGFSCLHKLEFLERLDLYRTSIETPTLCKILKNNPHMRHLSIAGMRKHFNADEVAVELGTSCPDLESVDFWKAMTLTWQGIDALSNCKNLREVDFSWCNRTGYGSRLHKLFSSCQRLEKVFLASFQGLTDRDLKELALCKHLKQLDLLGALSLTPEICFGILLNCPKLELLDLSFCDYISDSQIKLWRQEYPHIAIKRITQNMENRLI
ncbi:F-box/LRR-repeat protein 4 isoform X2 [Pseudomyrmex gracilis]|uniref:F-box/LRR-repeat protein 4 isoform X2 n=1 Tax=Pseudomyrmex gracilis TaxID=219809 RepID=UPI0009953D9B|nr:F-box/LRR-repeat protein 4 isoform X2 [Pseudomyrmex gracilis]